MQKVARDTIMHNDSGLLNSDQIPAFREWLVGQGMDVRDASGAGQFFHFRINGKRWVPVERGRGAAAVTPITLRPFINEFLKKPLNSAMGVVIAARQHFAPVELVAADLVAPDPVQADSPTALVSLRQPRPSPPVPAKLSQYLSDLRDDFALHAPLIQLPGESVRTFAIRRWEYADVMLATRGDKYGD